MYRVSVIVCAFVMASCSTTFTSKVVNVDGQLSIPWLEGAPTQQVVYPAAGAAQQPAAALPAMYGPLWHDEQGRYPEYRFN